MSKLHEQPAVTSDLPAVPVPPIEQRIATRPAAVLAIFTVTAVVLAAWFVVSAGTTNVSAAAGDEATTPYVPYFPSLYTNQASEPSAVPATF